MKTIKELKDELDKYPDHYYCYAYSSLASEGEGTGISIQNTDAPFKDWEDEVVEGMYETAGWIDLEPS